MQSIFQDETLVNPTPAPATIILKFNSFTGSTPPSQIFVNGQSAEQSEQIYRYISERFTQS